MRDFWRKVKTAENYRKLWILLREKLTHYENGERVLHSDAYHDILTEMAEMEAAEFLED